MSGQNWRLPPQKLLKRSKDQAQDRREIEGRGRVLERSLAAHGVETHLVGYTVGPTVTRFELELGAGVKVARVTNLNQGHRLRDGLTRRAHPRPDPRTVRDRRRGAEQRRQLVTLGDVLAPTRPAGATHPLEVALGRDIAGRAVMVNLAEMPHLLIAGATGAGKSSCINSVITSILMRSTPEQVRLILVDPKRVELGQYNGLPHLLTQVVVNPKRAANALAWAVTEMERRYDLLAEAGCATSPATTRRSTGRLPTTPVEPSARPAPAAGGGVRGRRWPGRNRRIGPDPRSGGVRARPAVDGDGGVARDGERAGRGRTVELPAPAHPARGTRRPGDAHAPPVHPRRRRRAERPDDGRGADVEESICRIAQMARAVGIHLVIATQRPSVDVITGVIKANIPSRLAFSVSSLADSRVILDQPGAERLVGRGDLLLLTASSSVPRRIQGPWVAEEEVRANRRPLAPPERAAVCERGRGRRHRRVGRGHRPGRRR